MRCRRPRTRTLGGEYGKIEMEYVEYAENLEYKYVYSPRIPRIPAYSSGIRGFPRRWNTMWNTYSPSRERTDPWLLESALLASTTTPSMTMLGDPNAMLRRGRQVTPAGQRLNARSHTPLSPLAQSAQEQPKKGQYRIECVPRHGTLDDGSLRDESDIVSVKGNKKRRCLDN